MKSARRSIEEVNIGGLTLGADPLATACALVSHVHGAPVHAFIVRKEPKGHGTQNWIEGQKNTPPGCPVLIVEDVVTTGGSTLEAIAAVREAGHEIAGVVTVLDRLAGGAERIREAAGGAPYEALATIDDIYPERPDRP